VVFVLGGLSAAFQQGCTLKPMDGGKPSALSGGVKGKMTWSACTSIVHDFVFEWPPKQGIPAGSTKTGCLIAQRMEKGHEDGFGSIRQPCDSHRQASGAVKPLRLWRATRSDG
jgi:hypothetical protein